MYAIKRVKIPHIMWFYFTIHDCDAIITVEYVASKRVIFIWYNPI